MNIRSYISGGPPSGRRGRLRGLALLAIAWALPALAAAHVRLEPDRTEPGRYITLTFWLYHGCGDAPTESFGISIPDGVVEVIPQVKAGWQIETEEVTYAEPARIYGRPVKSGFSEVRWTGGNVPSRFMDHFIIAAFVLDSVQDDLRFTTEQRCTGRLEPEASALTLRVLRPERQGSAGAASPAPRTGPESTSNPQDAPSAPLPSGGGLSAREVAEPQRDSDERR